MENLIDLIKVTEFKKESSNSICDLNYYEGILNILNKLSEEI